MSVWTSIPRRRASIVSARSRSTFICSTRRVAILMLLCVRHSNRTGESTQILRVHCSGAFLKLTGAAKLPGREKLAQLHNLNVS